ncbi:MAG TPA: hypothetical protein VFT04_05165 [Gemmatimonadales bacterium]|nr:hypothetical protein [Gemmatimonadales bacterium]
MTGRVFVSRAAAVGAAAGGLLIATGAVLPWMTLYGGLHPLRGILGPYGQLLFAAGIGCATGALFLARFPRRLGSMLLGAAAGVFAFASWLAFGSIPGTLERMQENPFLVASQGNGPHVALVGALMVLCAGAIAVLPAGRGSRYDG